jgi:hypothetical protein
MLVFVPVGALVDVDVETISIFEKGVVSDAKLEDDPKSVVSILSSVKGVMIFILSPSIVASCDCPDVCIPIFIREARIMPWESRYLVIILRPPSFQYTVLLSMEVLPGGSANTVLKMKSSSMGGMDMFPHKLS